MVGSDTETIGSPEEWAHHACGMSDVPRHDRWLTAPEAQRIASFRFEKRRSETRMSRWTAKQAVGVRLGLPVSTWAVEQPELLQTIAIHNRPGGAPHALVAGRPAPVSISMTDRADWSVCLVTGDPDIAVGCDLELVEPRSAAFVSDWFTDGERRLVGEAVADHGPQAHDLLANLIWSAKESALKVLQTGLRRDTRSVEVRLGGLDVLDTDEWRPFDVASLEPDDHGALFPGWWSRFGDFVLTCASTTPTGPPSALVEPTPLSAAVPTHAWMQRPVRVGVTVEPDTAVTDRR